LALVGQVPLLLTVSLVAVPLFILSVVLVVVVVDFSRLSLVGLAGPVVVALRVVALVVLGQLVRVLPVAHSMSSLVVAVVVPVL
jgi:hypothetical protein